MIYLEKIKLKKKSLSGLQVIITFVEINHAICKNTNKSLLGSKNVLRSLRNAEQSLSVSFISMLLIKEKRPTLKQTDSIPAKLFT